MLGRTAQRNNGKNLNLARTFVLFILQYDYASDYATFTYVAAYNRKMILARRRPL